MVVETRKQAQEQREEKNRQRIRYNKSRPRRPTKCINSHAFVHNRLRCFSSRQLNGLSRS